MEAPDLDPVVRRFVEDAGNLTQSFGLGRVVGQIYIYLYFSPVPRSLADMKDALGISKGSASTGVRQLEQWSAVRKVWVKGDRKDYYEANDWLGKIVKGVVADVVGSKMSSLGPTLTEMSGAPSGSGEREEFVRARIEHLRTFYRRIESFWRNPLLQKLLK